MKPVQVDAQYLNTLLKTLVMLERKSVRGGVPPKGAQTAAARGLELRREFGRGGTMVGVARARDISNGKNLSESTVRRMKAYFDRHEVDKQGKDWDNTERPSNGKIAWLLWGGDAGRTWATMLVNRWNKEDGKKELPLWLPNGDEIESVAQLAAVLNTDTKTAAYHVLDAENPPKGLLLQAARITNTKVRRVSTPEGRRRFGQPIGTIIKDDILPDLQMELPGMPEKPKPRKRPVIKLTYEEGADKAKPTLEPLLKNGRISFPPMKRETEQLPDTPVYDELPEYKTTWEEVSSNPELLKIDQQAIQDLYDSILNKGDDWTGSSDDAMNLKANVQYRLSKRMLDHLDTDEDLQNWVEENRAARLTMVTRSIKRISAPAHENGNWSNEEFPQTQRLQLLKDVLIIDSETTLEDASTGEYASFINLDTDADMPEDLQEWTDWIKTKFPRTKDRDALVRLGLIVELGLIGGDRGFADYDKYTEHSTEELMFLLETKSQITSWAGTSGDTKPESVAFQLDVKEAFELDESITSHMKYLENPDTVRATTFRQTLIRAMYAETQEFLKVNNITHVEIYRGMYFDNQDDVPKYLKGTEGYKVGISLVDERLQQRKDDYISDYVDRNYDEAEEREFTLSQYESEFGVTEIKNDDSYKKYRSWYSENKELMSKKYKENIERDAEEDWLSETGSYDSDLRRETLRDAFSDTSSEFGEITMQPISSWSLDPEQADSFADSGNYKIVLRTIVPAELIFSTVFSGIGCLSESEIVVLGGLGKAEIKWK
jgi:hypothetical protein